MNTSETNARILRRKLALLPAMVVAIVATASIAADTLWVDDDWYNQGGIGTEASPYGTIQDAVEAAASGDTIKVKAGVYDKGGMVNTTGDIKSRVRVFDKQLHLVAVDGKENTLIVGASDPTGAADGRGPNAVRCVIVAGTGSDGTVIEGFTICGGRTDSEIDSTSANNGKGFGAGVYDRRGQRKTYVVDCVISNCVACNGGGLTQGTAYRTLIENCHATRWGGASQASSLHTCIIAHCGGADAVCNSLGKAINCTFVANTSGLYYNGDTQFYNCIVAGSAANGTASKEKGIDTATCTKTATHGYHQVMAPAFGDYRPIAGTPVLTMGNPEYLDDIAIPGYTLGENMTDFEGNLYPLASAGGTIAAGAIQTAATPAGGVLQFNDCTNGLVIDGVAAKSGDYLYPESYPTQYNVKVLESEGQHLFCLSRDTNDGGRLHPQMNDTFWLMPPPDMTRASTNAALFAAAAFWCDANSGLDTNAGTAEAPFKSIQKAVDSTDANTYTVIYAGEGDYNIGADGAPGKIHASTHPLTNRVYIASNKRVFIRGAGAGKSFITGAHDPVTGGAGTGAIRPVASQSALAAVQGFTLRDAEAYYATGNTGASYMTAGAFAGQPGTHLLDCTVTGCVGSGAVVFNAKVERCQIFGNTTRNYVVHGNSSSANPIVSSVVADNCDSSYYVAVGYAQCVNVTAKGSADTENKRKQLVIHNSTVTSLASLFVTGRWAAQSDDTTRHVGLLAWNLNDNSLNTVKPSGATYADPYFCSAGLREYRVIKSSPAYTCGVVPTASNYGADYWKYAGGDVNGNRLVFTDGKPMSGACHTTATADIYVDGTNGNDSNDGKTFASAKKTIAAALAGGIPSDAVGATVHVAAGSYGSDTPADAPGSTVCKSRVVVPTGVTLEGAGADVTEIVGAAAAGDDRNGLGEGAVRCVYLNPHSTLRGFTLRDGYTATGSNASDANNYGAGVYGASALSAEVEDCIITNCTACRGGGAVYATLRRCRIFDCKGVGSAFTTKASATLESRHFNTIIDNCGEYAVCYPKEMENCTLGSGNIGNNSVYLIGQDYCRMVNSLFMSPVNIRDGHYDPDCNRPATNCIFAVANKGDYAQYLGPGSSVGGSLTFGGDGYTPVIGENAAVDAGDVSINKDTSGKDAYGNQRVYNNTLDIGAVEANWCDKFAADISGGKKRFVVTAASPEVVETADVVQMTGGTTLDATWRNGSARRMYYMVRLRLAAGSEATVMLNGELLATCSTEGVHELKFDSALVQNLLSFACTAGSVDVLSAERFNGTTISIR